MDRPIAFVARTLCQSATNSYALYFQGKLRTNGIHKQNRHTRCAASKKKHFEAAGGEDARVNAVPAEELETFLNSRWSQ